MNEVKHAINPACVIFGGDLVTDICRTLHQSYHTRELLPHSVLLTVAWQWMILKYPPYTYIGLNGDTSRIDHFLISDILSESACLKSIYF